ncbi:MAG: short-chain dehydrogenase, partial [Acidobacteria bacterium]
MTTGDRAALLRQALGEVRELRARLDAAERMQHEPVAVIGMACRFPGADDPAALWRLVSEGVDAISEVPAERWDVDAFYDPDPAAPGKMISRWGGFLKQVDLFDADFFGLSQREAARTDPQQRLVLEVAWEALEDAALPATRVAGTRTGVVVGACANDYHRLHASLADADAYDGAGNAMSILANRVSYLLDLRGPSITIDTACSSSLVAVHLACGLLRSGEADLALAGGVQLMLAPDSSIVFSKTQLLARDGRCKTFDARADGMVRSEGCGIVVLKRLSEALADGDPIWTVILGSAVNQDGRSNGLTAPSVLAQQEVIRRALQSAGVEPRTIGYVEAHGTGTALGDPIEIDALKAVVGAARPDGNRCAVGSVKANLGHLEAAAGVAGLIKAALVVKHGVIPPHLHLKVLNPSISLEGTPFFIATETAPWPAGPAPRRAEVSSFGLGGTNAHAVVEEPPARPEHLLVLSAATPEALSEQARRYARLLSVESAPPLGDVCHTAAVGRVHLAHRLAARAADAQEMVRRLEAVAAGAPDSAIFRGRAATRRRVAFLFTGQGAQYPGMARELYETQASFRAVLERSAELLSRALDRSLLEVLFDARAAPLLDETEYTQPALFAVEYALAGLWRSWGVEPDVVLGHSVGECVAAAVAGVFSLEEALRLVAARGRLTKELAGRGAMAAAATSERHAAEVIARSGEEVAIAAVNGPTAVTLSGRVEALEPVLAALEGEGIEAQRLRVSHAFHSGLLDPMLASFEAEASKIAYAPPRIPVVSNVTGLVAGPEIASAAYWRRQVRAPVRFFAGMQTLAETGVTAFIEVGPHPVLLGLGQVCAPGDDSLWLPSLRRGRGDWEQMLGSLARLHVLDAAPIDWRGFDRDYGRRRVRLPTYPWQRRRFWIDEPRTPQAADVRPRGADQGDGAWRDWLYTLEWRPRQPLEHGCGIRPSRAAAPADLALRLEEHCRVFGGAPGEPEIPVLAGVDDVCARFAAEAVASLGAALAPGQRIGPEDSERLGVVATHRRLFARLLEILAEDGILRRDGPSYEVVA